MFSSAQLLTLIEEKSWSEQPLRRSVRASYGEMLALPIELVLEVLDALVRCPEDDRPIALPASDPTTKALLSFTRACRATHHRARQHLFSHCLYIDSSTRLRQLLLFLEGLIESNDTIIDHDVRLGIESLYLSPFSEPTIDDLPVAKWSFDLLSFVAPTLKRLVVNINFMSLLPWSDHLNVLPTLKAGLEQLMNLEEFASTASDLVFSSHIFAQTPVWCRWPKLQKLAIFSPQLHSLTDLAVQWPAALSQIALGFSTDLNGASFRASHRDLLMIPNSRKLRIFVLHPLAAVEHRRVLGAMHDYSIRSVSDDPAITIVGNQAPEPAPASLLIGELHEVYQEYFRDEAISGELWHLGGLFLGERRPPLALELL